MSSDPVSRPGQQVSSRLLFAVRTLVLLLPGLLLLVATVRAAGRLQLLLWLGTAVQILLACLLTLSPRGQRTPAGPAIILTYLVGLAWLWASRGPAVDWYSYFAQAVLLVGTLGFFAVQSLTESGALGLRRAKVLAGRLGARQEWPADLAACRSLPEVKALREAVHADAAPALALLRHPRLPVRVAALAALEFRPHWAAGQAELVLHVAQRAPEPPLRAAAVMALGNVEDRLLIEQLAEFLRDPAWEVRRAAAEALLWESATRWSWVREAVRHALGEAAFADDGALRHEGELFAPEAVADLTAWATEPGCTGVRAAKTLGFHYGRALSERPDAALVGDLKRQLSDPHAPAALRMELAQLLQAQQLLDAPLLERLLDPSNPAPLRLLAAETLLTSADHPVALATLRDIARLPNREIALATADIVQRRLGVDLGLALGQPLPPLHSRLAAEVTRRVMLWASQAEQPTPPPPRTVLSKAEVGSRG